jgi:hypothetical protein
MTFATLGPADGSALLAEELGLRAELASGLLADAGRLATGARRLAAVSAVDDGDGDEAEGLSAVVRGAADVARLGGGFTRNATAAHLVARLSATSLAAFAVDLLGAFGAGGSVAVRQAAEPDSARALHRSDLTEALPVWLYALARGDAAVSVSVEEDGAGGIVLSAVGPCPQRLAQNALRLPAAREDTVQVASARFLTFEPSAGVRLLLEEMTAPDGVTLEFVDTTRELLALMDAPQAFDGVMLDPTTRALDWRDLVQRASSAARAAELPPPAFVALVFAPPTTQVRDYLRNGFSAVVEKPPAGHVLRDALRDALARRRVAKR